MGKYNFLFQTDLSHRAKAVYMYLQERAGKQNTCFPSIKTIAKELSFSVSTVKRAIRDLQMEGFLDTQQRTRENGGNSTLLYTLKIT